MNTEQINLTAAELEFIRLKREQEEIKKQQDALQEQLNKDKEERQARTYLQQKVSKNEQETIRMKEYYQILCSEGCERYATLEESPVRLYPGYHDAGNIFEDVIRMSIVVGSYKIYKVAENNKTECNSITGSYREYLAKGLAKKILEKVQQLESKQTTENKLKEAKESLIAYFTKSSPEGTIISTQEVYESNYNGHGSYSSGTYRHVIKLEYPNKSWAEIRYSEDGSWSITQKFDSKYPTHSNKEEWLEYLKS